MRQFFQGWRRKIGCVLLAIAATMSIVWCVSFHALCWWDFSPIKNSGIKTLAGDGCLTIVVFHNVADFDSVVDWGSTGQPECIYVWERENHVWIMRSPHIRYGRETGPVASITTLSVSFSLIVIPLTLLSAYLLLRKPRPRPDPAEA